MSLKVIIRSNVGASSGTDNFARNWGGQFLTQRLCGGLCGEMPTNLQIDDRLLAKAQKVGGFRTKKDTVNHALSEFVRRRQQKDIASLFGMIDFAPDFDYKKLRARR
jgi:Bacterial antitoxin of type II TA system, VapB